MSSLPWHSNLPQLPTEFLGSSAKVSDVVGDQRQKAAS